jgi:hypothetical protein
MAMRTSLTVFFALGIALSAAIMPSPTLAQSRANVLEGLPQGLTSRPEAAEKRGIPVRPQQSEQARPKSDKKNK